MAAAARDAVGRATGIGACVARTTGVAPASSDSPPAGLRWTRVLCAALVFAAVGAAVSLLPPSTRPASVAVRDVTSGMLSSTDLCTEGEASAVDLAVLIAPASAAGSTPRLAGSIAAPAFNAALGFGKGRNSGALAGFRWTDGESVWSCARCTLGSGPAASRAAEGCGGSASSGVLPALVVPG